MGDLTSKVPLAWLGALPEAVVRARKEGASDNDVISLLGSNVDAESYEGDVCGDTLANTRCYAQMTKVKDEDLDSWENLWCERSGLTRWRRLWETIFAARCIVG